LTQIKKTRYVALILGKESSSMSNAQEGGIESPSIWQCLSWQGAASLIEGISR
jgi:hypothetical protein